MNTAKLVTMLVLILLLGIFAGSLGTRIYLRHELQKAPSDRRNPEEKVDRIVARLSADLKLDSGQQRDVRKIVTASEARAAFIRTLYEPELKRIYDVSFAEITEKLNASQKTELQKKQEKLTARYNAMYFSSLRIALLGPHDMDALSGRLGLDASQRAKVGAVLEDEKKRADLIIEKYQKTKQPDLMAVNRDIMEIRFNSLTSISQVMTEEQFERFKKDLAY